VWGKLEAEETGWQAALREIREETGLTPDRLYSANVLEAFYDAGQNCINLVPVFVALVEGDPPVRLSPEHDAYRWITAEEGDAYLVFQQQKDMLHTIEAIFVRRPPNPLLEIKLP
jgi:dATP pyrophosphohydrolase